VIEDRVGASSFSIEESIVMGAFVSSRLLVFVLMGVSVTLFIK